MPPRAFASWHSLDELSLALHFVQAYIEDLPAPGSLSTRNAALAALNAGADPRPSKRKAPGLNDGSRDTGLLTPLPSHLSASRSASVSSADVAQSDGQSEAEEKQDWREITVYNGILQRREGRITMKRVRVHEPDIINLAR